MHIFGKIKEKMCMSKTSAVIGFRVTLRYAVSHKRTGSISNPCTSFISWPCSKIAQVQSRLEERHLLHKSEGAEAEDWKEIPSWIKQPTNFHWWWNRGRMNSFTKKILNAHRLTMMTTWWTWLHRAYWWLEDPPAQHQRLRTSLTDYFHSFERAVERLLPTIRWLQTTPRWIITLSSLTRTGSWFHGRGLPS